MHFVNNYRYVNSHIFPKFLRVSLYFAVWHHPAHCSGFFQINSTTQIIHFLPRVIGIMKFHFFLMQAATTSSLSKHYKWISNFIHVQSFCNNAYKKAKSKRARKSMQKWHSFTNHHCRQHVFPSQTTGAC